MPGAKFVACLFLFAASANAAEEKWITCSTPKTPFTLTIPESLIHSTAPTATGCSFQTPDGEFTVEAVLQPENASDPAEIDARMQKEIDLMAGTVTYKKKGESWFVISGVTPDGTEYYRKLFLRGSDWVTMRITYPHAGHKKYDKWVTRIEKTFVPFAQDRQAPDAALQR